ncbi:hypothetical protein MUK42_13877 [Musa troglodytarum]|uniref:Uncharacterized protein n=1 Tax=Musa troglodytarum TaxID=320322 RepID=A0A9E7I3J4_9LILI|nr:hypothetical protein MUK42_13877 [Musa troglodytarum]URE44922.1 hypothetical protein MUK42_13877 [Musa troglodytarum]
MWEEKETSISIFLATRSGKKFHGLLSPTKGNSVGRTAPTVGTLVDAEPTNQSNHFIAPPLLCLTQLGRLRHLKPSMLAKHHTLL